MEVDELIEQIFDVAAREGIDLESLGVIGEDDVLRYALQLMLVNLEKLPEMDIDLTLSEEDDEIESDYFEDEI